MKRFEVKLMSRTIDSKTGGRLDSWALIDNYPDVSVEATTIRFAKCLPATAVALVLNDEWSRFLTHPY